MASNEHIAAALNRVVKIFEKKPAAGLDTNRTRARLENGLKCVVREDEHSATIDMGEIMGGEGAGPGPGFFGRASLASCVAIGLKMAAARAGVPIDAIDVDVEMDWDNRGLLGMGDAPAATTGIRLYINVHSRAPKEAVQAAIGEGLKNDPWLHTFINPQTIDPDIRIN